MDPRNIIRDQQVLKRKLEEGFYDAAMQEFQSGNIRSGLMAKAVAESNGNEENARATYIKFVAVAIRDDHYIVDRLAKPKGDAPVLLAGGCSLVIPGLGQLLQGRIGAALGFFFSALLLWMILLGWIIHIWAMINAAKFERARHN